MDDSLFELAEEDLGIAAEVTELLEPSQKCADAVGEVAGVAEVDGTMAAGDAVGGEEAGLVSPVAPFCHDSASVASGDRLPPPMKTSRPRRMRRNSPASCCKASGRPREVATLAGRRP